MSNLVIGKADLYIIILTVLVVLQTFLFALNLFKWDHCNSYFQKELALLTKVYLNSGM